MNAQQQQAAADEAVLESRRQRQIMRTCTGSGCAESNLGMAFPRGTKVLDTVTGMEGTIIAGKTSHSLIEHPKR